MFQLFSRSLLITSILATALLSACGSGNNTAAAPAEPSPNVTGSQVPVAATQDAAAAQAFVASIVATGEANTEVPIALGDAVLATSESADFVPLGA
jgi:ABC-type Fe3+-hydroxamate transport system substrate-binding protein